MLLGVLAVSLVALAFYTFTFYQEKQNDLKSLRAQKTAMTQKLEKMQSHYDRVLELKTGLDQRLQEKQAQIKSLLDSVETLQKDFRQLKKYQIEVEMLERQNQDFSVVIDSLLQKNQKLQAEIDSTTNDLNRKEKAVDSLDKANTDLNEKLTKAQKLKVSNLKIDLAEKNIQKAKVKDDIKKLKICFDVSGKISAKENQIYIQVINPKNNLIGGRHRIEFGRKVLNYSKAMEVDLSKKQNCVNLYCQVSSLKSGTYTVNIFYNISLLDSKTFEVE